MEENGRDARQRDDATLRHKRKWHARGLLGEPGAESPWTKRCAMMIRVPGPRPRAQMQMVALEPTHDQARRYEG